MGVRRMDLPIPIRLLDSYLHGVWQKQDFITKDGLIALFDLVQEQAEGDK